MKVITAKLVALQEEMGLNNARVAKVLESSAPVRSRIRPGQREMGTRILLRALYVFPEISSEFLLAKTGARGTGPSALCQHVAVVCNPGRCLGRPWSTPSTTSLAGNGEP